MTLTNNYIKYITKVTKSLKNRGLLFKVTTEKLRFEKEDSLAMLLAH